MDRLDKFECKRMKEKKHTCTASKYIRLYFISGNATDTRGTAFVVYEDIFDAKNACEHLQGFNILGRYLIVLYYQQNKITKKMNLQKKEEEIKEMKAYVYTFFYLYNVYLF